MFQELFARLEMRIHHTFLKLYWSALDIGDGYETGLTDWILKVPSSKGICQWIALWY